MNSTLSKDIDAAWAYGVNILLEYESSPNAAFPNLTISANVSFHASLILDRCCFTNSRAFVVESAKTGSQNCSIIPPP